MLLAVIPVNIARYSELEVIEMTVSLLLCAIVRSLYSRLSSRPKTSAPSVKSVMVSAFSKALPPLPERTTIVSEPEPDRIVSAPVPPSKILSPSEAERTSSPEFLLFVLLESFC